MSTENKVPAGDNLPAGSKVSDRLRVLLLIPHLGGGGAEQVAALLAKGLSDRKYEIHLGLVTQESIPAGALPPTVIVHALGASRVRRGAPQILRLVRRIEPDVILSGMFHLNFVVLMLRPFFPARTAVIVRQNTTVSASLEADALPWYTGWLYRVLYRFADRIVCQSRAMADDLVAELGVAADRLAVLPNPVDFEDLLSPTEPAAWPGLGPHLLAVGRLAPEKGFELLLEAVALIRRDFPDADLVIAGKGPEQARLKALAAQLKIADAVRFAGYVDRPARYYAGADIFVLSSRREGMPNVLLEALASGLPVVATPASGGVVDLLSGRANAWLAAEVSAAGLAQVLKQAIETLQAHMPSWDRQRSEKLVRNGARIQALLGTDRLIAEDAPVARMTDEPIAPHYAVFGGEFDFEHAFEAYEALIDTLCAGCRA
jgi:glycosyltransferase involved in cell wall biosynthesis